MLQLERCWLRICSAAALDDCNFCKSMQINYVSLQSTDSGHNKSIKNNNNKQNNNNATCQRIVNMVAYNNKDKHIYIYKHTCVCVCLVEKLWRQRRRLRIAAHQKTTIITINSETAREMRFGQQQQQ